jgi:BirA family biotin operon repressor/biotin-[acetyl-CoA-carboxylase] ligase
MKTLSLSNPFGAPVYHRETVSSTMDEARALACRGEPHGTVIAADFQEAGRGRNGRVWQMDSGANLSFTLLLRYPGFAALPPALTLKAGLAVSLGIGDFAPPLVNSVLVKWPNDVLLCPKKGIFRKAAGILTEAEGALVCVGIGVNAAQREFPPELQNKAGSIRWALEQLPGNRAGEADFSREALFRLMEMILIRFHRELEGREDRPWKERLEERLYMRGQRVRFAEGAPGSQNIVEGTLTGTGDGGELLIVPWGAKEARSFTTGELELSGADPYNSFKENACPV